MLCTARSGQREPPRLVLEVGGEFNFQAAMINLTNVDVDI